MSAESILAEIKAKQAAREATPKTPLWVFLYLYIHTTKLCYPEYMAGAKELAKFLDPIEVPIAPATPIHKLLNSYTTYELAKIVHSKTIRSSSDILSIAKIHNAIIHLLLTDTRLQ